MPKLKTRKAVASRFKKRKSGKIEKRSCGQGHFKARETGNKTRSLRKDDSMDSHHKTIEQQMPYAA